MPKTKWPQVKEQLPVIENWARQGLTEIQIAKNLGVGVSTLSEYKIRYPELAEALKKGRATIVAEIENVLVKRALGFNFEEVKTSIRMINGIETKYTEKIKKYALPDVGACCFLLKNKDRGNGWSDNPQKIALEKQMFEHRKRIENAQVFGDDIEDSSAKQE